MRLEAVEIVFMVYGCGVFADRIRSPLRVEIRYRCPSTQ